ncbi:MAG TPA: hypothetical protein VNA24_14430 [Hyalangium sp.]|nr:hypothetical protein [Hyalangium sp.]
MAPMTTAVLPSTSPRVAIPTATTSWNQYEVASRASVRIIDATSGSRSVGPHPSKAPKRS